MTNAKRVIVMDDADFDRLEDGEAITFEYDHMDSVTLVAERWRNKWKNALRTDRPEDRGTVVFLGNDDYQQIKYSHSGVRPQEGIVIAHESKEHLVFDDQSNQPNEVSP